MPSVLVTGLGAVTPCGRGVPILWDCLVAGRTAFKPVTLFDASPFRSRLAGQVDGYPPDPAAPPRALRFALDAAREACAHAGLAPGGFDRARAAVFLGTNFGGMSAAETALTTDAPDLSAYAFGAQADAVARAVSFEGPRTVVSLSCASGAAAIGLALSAVRSGRADLALALGYDELSRYCFAGLSALRAMTRTAVKPFDVDRGGTLFSEGAGALLLESADHARRRGARPLAEVRGCAMNNDAFHMTAPEQEGRGIAALMRAALADARLQPSDIDCVNAHATATQYNDAIETRAIKAVFGEHARKIPVTANKSMIGHLMGAAGAVEAIAAIRSITDNVIPPTVGLDKPDEGLDLDYVPGVARRGVNLRFVMKNSYGIGGTNASVIFGRAEGA
jgi:3-oxoacyl-[acyl-carrier-protein] synthase II